MVARIIANGLSKALSQSVIVESKAGASGRLRQHSSHAPAPDGYTLMVIPSGHATAAATFAQLPYRSIDDLHHDQYCVRKIRTSCHKPCDRDSERRRIISTRVRGRTTALRHARNGVRSHLAIELFALKTKIKVLHVPYRGMCAGGHRLVGGRLDFYDGPAGKSDPTCPAMADCALSLFQVRDTISLCLIRRPSPKVAFLDSR